MRRPADAPLRRPVVGRPVSTWRTGAYRRVTRWALLAAVALTTAVAVSVMIPHLMRPPTAALQLTGSEQLVFDWSEQACEPSDYPDLPVRALRAADGRVSLTIANITNRRLVGPNFDRLSHPCDETLRSDKDAAPARWNDREWIASTWSADGTIVDALVHSEYQGHRHPGRCPSGVYRRCWWNAVTLAVSTDAGATYTHRAPPSHVVAEPRAAYTAEAGPAGLFAPTNIVRSPSDGWLYALVHLEEPHGASGVCLLRTRTPGVARSWQAWRRGGFGAPARVSEPACRRVAPHRIGTMSSSLTWNTELGRYVLLGVMAPVRDGRAQPGVWYATSDNLLNWSVPSRLLAAELPWTYRCGDPDPVAYPSLVDHASPSRNFDVIGRRAFLYVTRMHYKGCRQTEDRDLVRIPVEIRA